MPFLYFLEGLRNPVFDQIFSLITFCGEETVFIVVGLIIFWCVSKKQGYYLLCTGFIGVTTNQFLKMIFRIPRPWVQDPNFTIVESARKMAEGYSFPSGHTQVAVGLFGGLARANRALWVRIVSIALCVLVPLSRMYLGVHTPLDVLVSVAIALFFVLIAYPLFEKAEKSPKIMYIVLSVITAVMLAFLIFINTYQFPPDVYSAENIANLLSAQKFGFTMMGCVLGFFVAYFVDEKFIHFHTQAVWWVQIIKAVGGLLLVLAVKELAKIPLNAFLPADTWATFIRYFLLVIVGGIVWPLTFRPLNKFAEKRKREK